MAAVSVKNVYKVFGRNPHEAVRRLEAGATRDEVKSLGTAAVIDASFEVEPGEIFVVMGLSGSGKSTLIRTLNGLWPTSGGQVIIGDQDLSKINAAEMRQLRRKRVSMVFQHFALLPHRSVLDNVAYPLEIQGVDRETRREKARTAVEMTGLGGWEDSLPSQLSGGMRQRVGLARALAAETDILLMDEAFSALDPLIRRDMQEQLLDLQHKLKKTIIFITHDLNEAMLLGTRIAVMRDGRVVQIGTAEEILSNPADDYVAKFVADVDRTRVLTAATLMERPKAVVQIGVGPRQANRIMRDAQVSGTYVVDRDRVLRGIIRDSRAVQAVNEGETTLANIVEDDAPAVAMDTPISEIFAPSAGSALPVPVVDAQGRLMGVIPRVVLLGSMVPTEAPGDSEAEDGETAGFSGAGNGNGNGNGITTIAELTSAEDAAPIEDQAATEGGAL